METIRSQEWGQFRKNEEDRCTIQTRSATMTDWDDDNDSSDDDYDGEDFWDMETIRSQEVGQFRNNEEDRCTAQTSSATMTDWDDDNDSSYDDYDGEDFWDMETIRSQEGGQFRNNEEDRCTAQPRVLSTTKNTKEAQEAREMPSYRILYPVVSKVENLLIEHMKREQQLLLEDLERREQRWVESLKRCLQSVENIVDLLRTFKIRTAGEVQRVQEQINDETQKLQQDTDPQVRQWAELIQKMSKEIVEQKARVSGNKVSVKDTCREVKTVLKQICDLVKDKWQSLSEDAKLKLDSVITKLWKMRAEMRKFIFCFLLLHELRDMFDSLKSDSNNISLNRGRLKYAFKMASMLVLWLSQDVETNPGPQFDVRTCLERYVRLLSKALRDDLETNGSIWSKKVANAAYNAGFSRNLRWNNPSSGKNKDSLTKLKERAQELIRVMFDRSCLPSNLPAFTDLDQKETQDKLRQYLKAEDYKTAVDALLSEPDFTTKTTDVIRNLTDIVQEKISSSRKTIHNPPATVSHINDFQQLADPQSLNDNVGDGNCPGNPSPLTTNMDTQRHEGGIQGPTNSVCTRFATTDKLVASRVLGTTRSDIESRTSDYYPENIMTATPCTSETDVSQSPEKQGDVNMVSSSDSDSFDRGDGVETSHDILGQINTNTDAPDDVVRAQLESGLCKFMQGDYVDTPYDIVMAQLTQGDCVNTLGDTCDMMDDVPLPTDTSEEGLMADIESGPSRVFNVDDVNTSPTNTCDMTHDASLATHTYNETRMTDLESGPPRVVKNDDVNTSRRNIPSAYYSPYDETRNDVPAADDDECDDDTRKASEPQQDVSEKNQVDTVCEGVYEILEACNTHDCEETLGMEAYEATAETDTQTSGTAETDTQAYESTIETDTQTSELTETDSQAVRIRKTGTQACVTVRENDTQACVTMRENDTQTCVTMRENDTQTWVTKAEIGTQTYLETTETNTQTLVTTAEEETQTHLATAEGNTQTHEATAERDTHMTTTDTDTYASGTSAETGQTPRFLGTCSLNQVDSEESETPPGRRSDESKKRKHEVQHLLSKKRRI